MDKNTLPIGKDKAVIVTDQSGKAREGTVINHDNGRYLVRFMNTNMSEFWSPEYVKEK
jgi:hypothetical protein